MEELEANQKALEGVSRPIQALLRGGMQDMGGMGGMGGAAGSAPSRGGAGGLHIDL